MSDPPTQPATSTTSTGTGYRFPRLFTQKLTLSPFTLSRLGWSLLDWDLQVRSLDLPDLDDEPLRLACGALGRQLRLNPRLDPQAGVPSFLNALQPSTWDTLYGLLRMAGPLAWPDVPGTQRNFETGKPVSRGKIDSSGYFVPTSPDGVIAGFGLPSPAIKIGKRFLSASEPDIHLYMYLNKDAFGNDMKGLVTGGGIQFGGKTSDGTPVKLRIGVGRDTAGGGAGFIKIQLGPDFAPVTPGQ
jgi:hypothetical protein